jgi:OmcA/MtrC family decaheme c-type cytochrome
VSFTVTDPGGNYIPNLGDANPTNATRLAYLRFAMSQLVPAAPASGDPDIWVTHTTRDATPENLTDNGDGTYTYVFATNLYGLYDPAVRQRLLLIVSGAAVEQAKNVIYDFVPAQLPGPFTFDVSREIITTQACNSCHERLGSPLGSASFHGGSPLAEGCVTCHTDSLGATRAMRVTLVATMVHKITRRWSCRRSENYVISPRSPSPGHAHCAGCRRRGRGNWNTRPSAVACGLRHDAVNFETGENHGVGPIPGRSRQQRCRLPYLDGSSKPT